MCDITYIRNDMDGSIFRSMINGVDLLYILEQHYHSKYNILSLVVDGKAINIDQLLKDLKFR